MKHFIMSCKWGLVNDVLYVMIDFDMEIEIFHV